MSYSLFINYRRDDSSGESKLIRDALIDEFGGRSVFMDVESIDAGDDWKKRLKKKLRGANTVIVVIGPNWLQAGLSEWAIRRIDEPKDWVRQELVEALKRKKKIIPVLVRGGKLPPKEVLPPGIRELLRKQSLEIRSECWDHDILLLLARLANEDRPGHVVQTGVGPYPNSTLAVPEPVSDTKLKGILQSEIPHWRRCESPLPEDPAKKRVELFREFTFQRFTGAIQFMNQVARGCDEVNHHPRWENIFRTLRVYLSTWDSGLHKITDRDVQLARYLDSAFVQFPGRAKRERRKTRG